MLILKDLDGKSFPVSSDIQLNTRTGTVLIPHEVCPVDVNWPDCSSVLFELIADEHDIAHAYCFTVNPHGQCKYLANIATGTFKGQDLPDHVYTGKASCKVKVPPPRQCQI